MKVICAWCKKELSNNNSSDKRITHSICRECSEWFIKNEEGYSMKEFLDTLSTPVLLVDENGFVKSANEAACKSLGKDLSVIKDQPNGKVIECAHARFPEGCGKTVHCEACTIRQAVTTTFTTGEDQRDVVAYRELMINEEETEVNIRISTKKSGSMIILRIDEMKPSKAK